MGRIIPLLLAMLVSTAGVRAESTMPVALASTIAGNWHLVHERTGMLRSIVRVEIRDGVANARVVSVHGDDALKPVCDRCRGELAEHPMVGLPVFTDLRFDDGRWQGGRILDPESGRFYRCEARLEKNGEVLRLRGYLGLPAFGRTLHWYRHRPL